MRVEKRQNILEITENFKIKQEDYDIILEAGDKIRVLSLSEAGSRSVIVQSKDWDRMMDLILAGKDGDNIARIIKDKDKAVARYIAGIKLNPRGGFHAFYDKAIELGATTAEIDSLIANTTVPQEVDEKYRLLKNKKLSNSFVSAISREVLKLGFDIDYLPHNGNALTSEGKYAMSRNGRKWTIGYKTEIITANRKISFIFDAITDEGGGTTYYSIHSFDNVHGAMRVMGQRELLTWLRDRLVWIRKNYEKD